MNWAARRRLIIVLIVLAALIGFASYELWPYFHKAPMCNDGVQNGTETGVDCGGSCPNLCTFEVTLPNVLWSRSFQVSGSVYNAVAYIENKNNAATESIPYEFRLYDTSGVFVTRVDGNALIPPLGHYAIVETGIQVGSSNIGRTTFEFSSTPVTWDHVPTAIEQLNVLTSSAALDTSTATPKLSATLTNPSSTATLTNTVVAAILYDANDNAVNVSRTIVPTLGPGASTPIVFTWPHALSAPVVRYDLLPIIDVFNTH